ncbi:hypothetical protein, partial [Leucobacter chromiireducens]|uniref:hypothetical protein n=1 Tax=Leucobacter chromiireducens TaxID=283877 RepID=UPI0013DDFBF4
MARLAGRHHERADVHSGIGEAYEQVRDAGDEPALRALERFEEALNVDDELVGRGAQLRPGAAERPPERPGEGGGRATTVVDAHPRSCACCHRRARRRRHERRL